MRIGVIIGRVLGSAQQRASGIVGRATIRGYRDIRTRMGAAAAVCEFGAVFSTTKRLFAGAVLMLLSVRPDIPQRRILGLLGSQYGRMDIRLLEPNVQFALLPSEPLLQPELRLLGMQLSERDAAHLILDMSRVEIITSPSIGGLLLLRKLQSDRGVRLVLCNVRLATKCILRVVGLDTIFTCVCDRSEAMKTLGLRSCWTMKSSGASVPDLAAASQV